MTGLSQNELAKRTKRRIDRGRDLQALEQDLLLPLDADVPPNEKHKISEIQILIFEF